MSVGSTAATGSVDVAGIRAVHAIRDDADRNLLITQTYCDLSRAMRQLIGTDASWCTFSTWSSRTIGYFIRGDVDPMLEDRLRRMPAWLRRIVQRPLVRIGRYFNVRRKRAAPRLLARGNREIFLEIGSEFARFIDEFAGTSVRDAGRWHRYRATIVPSPATDVFPAADAELLRSGMASYFEAMYEVDSHRRAELVLRGNILLADYEQQRVDLIVRSALSLFPSRLLHDEPGDDALLAVRDKRPWALQDTGWFRTRIDDTWGWLITKLRMAIVLPGGPSLRTQSELIRVGYGLPDPGRDDLYPSRLHTLFDPALRRAWDEHDRARGAFRAARAKNWTRFGDRMNCIVNVFRARQAHGALYDVDPLTPDELERAEAALSARGR